MFEVDFIADKHLIPEETAVMKAYREKQHLTDPIYKPIKNKQSFPKKIVEKPTFDYDK